MDWEKPLEEASKSAGVRAPARKRRLELGRLQCRLSMNKALHMDDTQVMFVPVHI